jgi:hypothetical protein
MPAAWLPALLVTALLLTGTGRASGLNVSGTFVDDDGDVHEPNIEAVFDAGITKGCGPGLFCPYQAVTRAQMATFLARALKLTPLATGPFTDLADSPHAGDINAIAAAGITTGCAAGRYCPADPVRRDEMATFLTRALKLAPLPTGPFTDVAAGPHLEAINAIAAAGITAGCAAGRYCPADPVLRDQMATFLTRAFRLTPRYPRISLSTGLSPTCTKDGLACWASGVVGYRGKFEVREGFYQVLPFRPGEQEALTSPATRVELTINGSPVGAQPLAVTTSGNRSERLFRSEFTLLPGTHEVTARWFWNGSLTQTVTLVVTVVG